MNRLKPKIVKNIAQFYGYDKEFWKLLVVSKFFKENIGTDVFLSELGGCCEFDFLEEDDDVDPFFEDEEISPSIVIQDDINSKNDNPNNLIAVDCVINILQFFSDAKDFFRIISSVPGIYDRLMSYRASFPNVLFTLKPGYLNMLSCQEKSYHYVQKLGISEFPENLGTLKKVFPQLSKIEFTERNFQFQNENNFLSRISNDSKSLIHSLNLEVTDIPPPLEEFGFEPTIIIRIQGFKNLRTLKIRSANPFILVLSSLKSLRHLNFEKGYIRSSRSIIENIEIFEDSTFELYSQRNLDFGNFETNHISSFLQMFKNLKFLDLGIKKIHGVIDRSNFSNILKNILDSLDKLEILKLNLGDRTSTITIDHENLSHFTCSTSYLQNFDENYDNTTTIIIRSIPKLEYLGVLSNDILIEFHQSRKSSNLKVLKLQNSSKFNAYDDDDYYEISKLPNLKVLNLGNDSSSKNDFSCLEGGKKGSWKNLRFLKTSKLKYLEFTSIRDIQYLRSLDISFEPSVLFGIMDMKSLENLKIRIIFGESTSTMKLGNWETDLCETLSKLGTLRKLEVELQVSSKTTKIQESFCFSMFWCLKNLEYLEIIECESITEENKFIIDLNLEGLEKLKNMKIGRKGSKSICLRSLSLKNLQSLKLMEIWSNRKNLKKIEVDRIGSVDDIFHLISTCSFLKSNFLEYIKEFYCFLEVTCYVDDGEKKLCFSGFDFSDFQVNIFSNEDFEIRITKFENLQELITVFRREGDSGNKIRVKLFVDELRFIESFRIVHDKNIELCSDFTDLKFDNLMRINGCKK